MSTIRLGLGLLLLLAPLVPTGAAGQPRPRITHPRAVSLEPAAAAQPGRICVAAFDDRDGDGARGRGEAARAGRHFLILDAVGLIVARGATDASGEYCSPGLAPGAYAVRETGTGGAAARTVTVAGAGTVRAAFGER